MRTKGNKGADEKYKSQAVCDASSVACVSP